MPPGRRECGMHLRSASEKQKQVPTFDTAYVGTAGGTNRMYVDTL